jgi:hypothetical protein
MKDEKIIEKPVVKLFKMLQYPLMIAIAAGGIVVYNGWNTVSIEPQLQYKQFKYFDSAERYLRENYGLSSDGVESFIEPAVGNYFFFQAGMMIEKVAPFEMTFLYKKAFPVKKEQILWYSIDDRFSLDLNTSEVYQRDKNMVLKLEGTLVFRARPFIDLLKQKYLKEDGFVEKDGCLVKPIKYDLQLSPNER